MILFNKEIVKVYIIDFFPDPTITGPLKLFLDQHADTTVLVPQTREEVFKFLSAIEQEIGKEGCLIHLVGHGDNKKHGFGRQGLSLTYEEMVAPFTLINERCGDRLIVNASLMCLTDPIHAIYEIDTKIFHACIYSTLTQSIQTLKQLLNIYTKCINGMDIRSAIDHENDVIEYSQEVRPFGYS
ncbi:MAG: hypothetical protein EOO42_00595 [Flavobacteriales bacterium]|nr:MAG: hypothetical protein EOO42_00595 [Flavobacteriales bacterium]